MRDPIPLHDVPKKLLDQPKWQEIRKLTSSEMEALCSLNAPASEGATDFFWKGSGSDAEARRCYRLSSCSSLEHVVAKYSACNGRA